MSNNYKKNTASKKETKRLCYEDFDSAEDRILNEAIYYLVSTFNTNLLVSKVRGKAMIECIKAAIPVARFASGNHMVEAYVDEISWNNRLHVGVVSVAVVVDGNDMDAELKFDCLRQDKDWKTVYEVVEDVAHFVTYCAYCKACDIEPKN